METKDKLKEVGLQSSKIQRRNSADVFSYKYTIDKKSLLLFSTK